MPKEIMTEELFIEAAKRDSIMAYWKQQKRRGYISTEEYDALDSLFEGTKDRKEAE